MVARARRAGLCDTCRHQRLIPNTRGSVFSLCERSRTDPDYPRYPRLPVVECAGYEPRAAEPDGRRVTRAGRRRDRGRAARRGGRVRRSWSRTADGDEHGAQAGAPPDRWTALRPAPLAPHRGRRRARGPLRLRDRAASSSGSRSAPRRRSSATTSRRDRWRRVRSMPVALNHAGGGRVPRRRLRARRLHRPRRPRAARSSTLYRYDPGRDRWARLPSAPTRAGRAGGRA